MKQILILIFSALTIVSNAQKIGIDSKGKSIFTHYSKKEARLEISSDEPLSVSTILFPKDRIWTRTHVPLDTTVKKFDGMLIELSMLNSGDFPVLTNLSDIKPGFSIKAGWQRSIAEFKKLNLINSGTYTVGVNGIFQMDNIDLYNTAKNLQEKRYPLTYGLEGNFSYFFSTYQRKTTFKKVFALNVSLTKTWNDDDLISYQNISDVTILPSVVALEKFKGRYGKLEEDITSFRTAVSFPMYLSILNPIPYMVLNIQSGTSPVYRAGLFMNILSKPLEKQNYSIPASLGIGVESENKHSHFSRPVVFLKGSIGIGELK